MSARDDREELAPRHPKILVVDDLGFFRSYLRALLNRAGFRTVLEAASGKEAITCLAGTRVDLVLLDISLPDVDGFAVLEAMDRLDTKATCVVVTAAASTGVVRRAVKAGARHVLVKPVEDERLVAAVKDVLE